MDMELLEKNHLTNFWEREQRTTGTNDE